MLPLSKVGLDHLSYCSSLNDEDEPKKIKTVETGLIEEFKIYGLYTSLHGLPNIVRSSHIALRVLWIIFTLASVAICFYMVYNNILGFLAYPVISKVRQVPQQIIKFPTVTICNENPFLTENASNYVRDYFDTKFSLNATTYSEIVANLGLNRTQTELTWLQYITNNMSFDKTSQFGYDSKDMFYELNFSGFGVNLTTDLESYYDPQYGVCFRVGLYN